MAFAHKLFTSLHNYNDPATRIGEFNRIWYDSINNVFRIQLDKTTPGGTVIGGGGGGGNYVLPIATTTTLGGIKIDGASITINNGVVTAISGADQRTITLTSKALANTVITLPRAYTMQDGSGKLYLDVFVDGNKWTKEIDYTETTTTSITTLVSIPVGSTITYRIEK
jgi:hypothetical protein